MAETYLIRMIQRRDTEANWSTANPILEAGEFGYNITNKKIKLGDGVTPWNTLPYFTNSNGDEVIVSWNDITGKPTIGNGTITIKQNGIKKGSFTVNQTGNTTIDLESGSTENPTTIDWREITNKPQIGSGTIFFTNNRGVQYGKVPLNSIEDITVKLPIGEGTGETGSANLIDLYTADNATLLSLYNQIYNINPTYIDKIVHYRGKICSNWCSYGANEVRFYHIAICNSQDNKILQSDKPFYVSLTNSANTIKVTYVETDDSCIDVSQNTETWTFALADGSTIEKQVIVK
jgi:hypothetical protein